MASLVGMLDLLDAAGRGREAWLILQRFLDLKELSIEAVASRIPVTLAELSASFRYISIYREFRDANPLIDYARILDELTLHPHPDVPEILYHLLIPTFSGAFDAIVQNSSPGEPVERPLKLKSIYTKISQTFASFRGHLAHPSAIPPQESLSDLLAGLMVAGVDIPLIEVSRQIGFLSGIAGADILESDRALIVAASREIHDAWVTTLLEDVTAAWGLFK